MNAPQQFCHSCGMPTENQYCEYCTDEGGVLKPREAVRDGITQWLASWGGDPDADYAARADRYMTAMPAWAKE